MNHLCLFILVLLVFSSKSTLANEELHQSSWYLEGNISYYKLRSSHDNYLITNDLYLGYAIDKNRGVYVSHYYDENFSNYFIGATATLSKYEFGLGVGESSYDNKDWLTLNTWLSHSTDKVELLINLEYTPDETASDRLYYQSHFNYWLTDSVYTGAYIERWVGTGPKLGVTINGNLHAEFIVTMLDGELSSSVICLKYFL